MDTESTSLPPVSCRLCRLGQFAIYGITATNTPDTVNTLRREVKTVAAGRTFIRDGEVQTYVHTLYSGWAFRYVSVSKGRQILFFHVPGDIIALESIAFPGMALPFALKSLTPVTLCSFPVEDAAEILRASQPQAVQAAVTAQRFFADTNRHLADIGRRSATGRLAQLLTELEGRLRHRQLSKNGTFGFPVRQEHLADALGLTTVYVNRTLDRLRKEGVIAFDRRSMTIRDPRRLHEIADEE
jgi:CRP/FNR family transcriptional regulator, anaerobic regulatory protein